MSAGRKEVGKRVEAGLLELYDGFKLTLFRSIFSRIGNADADLTAGEALALEAINQLDRPTIGRFAELLGVSQSNATYKVNSLVKKGYLERQSSELDRRECRLVLTEKYDSFVTGAQTTINAISRRIERSYPKEQVDSMVEALHILGRELINEELLNRE